MRAALLLPCLGMLLLPLTGCGSGASYSGTVTYDGNDVEEGHISFIPLDGQGSPVGAPILHGKYKITGLTSGKKRVHVSAVKQLDRPVTSADPNAPLPEPIPTNINLIPPDAVGNHPTIDVTPGSHKLDLHLEKPRPK